MIDQRDVLFALVRSGLYGTQVDVSQLPESISWPEIINMAKKQTMLGIVADAIFRLPKERQPDVATMAKLRMFVMSNVNTHARIDKALAEVFGFYDQHGIHAILLKGQGVARCYREPLLRQCGDIDLYVGKKAYSQACQLALDHLCDPGDKSKSTTKHMSINHAGISVEIHRVAAKMYIPWRIRAFKSWLHEELDLSKDRQPVTVIDGAKVHLAPLEANIIFVFFHLWHHFMMEGVGLRQFCDLSMLLHRHHDQIDVAEIGRRLKSFGMLRQWQIIGYILVNKLGLPQQQMPLYSADVAELSTQMLDFIFYEGNFGQYDPINNKNSRPKSFFNRKFYGMKRYAKRAKAKFRFAPAETSCLWAYMTTNGIINAICKKDED